MMQHVLCPTRYREHNEPSVLDLVLTNSDIIDDLEYLSPIGKSDHVLLGFTCTIESELLQNATKFNYTKGNYDDFRNYMDRNWSNELSVFGDDIDAMWEYFSRQIFSGMKQFIPYYSNWKKKKKWNHPINHELKELIHRKHRLWSRWTETRDEGVKRKYNKVRNVVRGRSRKLEQKIQRDIANNCSKTNPKKFWKYVRSKKDSVDTVGTLRHLDEKGEPVMVTDNEQKANVFAVQFSKVFTREPDDTFENIQPKHIEDEMPELFFSEPKILKALTDLKVDKSPGPDYLHPRVLKEIQSYIVEPLKIIFDLSIKTGRLPHDWQAAVVSPIYKKGDKSDPANYRPISLTSIVCKIIERFIRDHIMDHFLKNNLFTKQQYGFIKGRSTVLQLLSVLDYWTEKLEKGGQVDVVYTDFEKAFDKVPHKRLLSKLHSYGITKDIVAWVKEFLINRQQKVRIKDSYSTWHAVLSGIPQGSVLGPLLFVIYINDLPDEIEKLAKISLFADDAKISKHIITEHDSKALQQALNTLTGWTEKWLLKLNVSKCQILSISRSNAIEYKYDITYNGTVSTLGRVHTMRDLGVLIDDKLHFSDHVYDKVHKSYYMLGLIKRNFEHLDPQTFVQLYKSLVRSNLEYAVTVWNPHKEYLIEELEKVQRRATKIVKVCRSKSYLERLQHLKLPTLKYRRTRGDMIEVYKILHDKYNSNAVGLNLNLSNIVHTRSDSYKLVKHRPKYDLRKFFFSERVVELWNSLPPSVVQAETVDTFKNRLDKYWSKQEVLYNYKAKFTGSGYRSYVT